VRELFIYYRAKVDDAQSVQTAVLAAQSQLMGERPALRARLLRRPGPGDEHDTWMETYAHAPDGIDEALQREIEARVAPVLAPVIAGARHTEAFVPCAS